KTDGPGSFTTLSQTFTANAGDRITGWAFFDAADYMPYNDHAEVVITSSGGGSVTVFSFSVSAVGDYGQTPWTKWQYTFPSGGTFTIQAQLTNALDNNLDSRLGFDALKLSPPVV